jgi:hypothetical protein
MHNCVRQHELFSRQHETFDQSSSKFLWQNRLIFALLQSLDCNLDNRLKIIRIV